MQNSGSVAAAMRQGWSAAMRIRPMTAGAIFGGNNARLYNYKPQMQAELANDQIAQWKDIYDKHGGDRSNLAYGYVLKQG